MCYDVELKKWNEKHAWNEYIFVMLTKIGLEEFYGLQDIELHVHVMYIGLLVVCFYLCVCVCILRPCTCMYIYVCVCVCVRARICVGNLRQIG